MKPTASFILFSLFFGILSFGQANICIPASLKSDVWTANWITCPDAPLKEYGVYCFRKSFQLPASPTSFVVHISADNRYKLYVNGVFTGAGPARGDLANWNYETLDIAKYLKPGKNTLAALVWNQGEYKPEAQCTAKTAFLLQGNDIATEALVNTGKSWNVIKNEAYQPTSVANGPRLWAYMVAGCGDLVDEKKYPFGWETTDYNDDAWTGARELENAIPVGAGSGATWYLTPRTIPMMENTLQRFKELRRVVGTGGIKEIPNFLIGAAPAVIPAHSRAQILIDQGVETVAYPVLKTSGGKGATVHLEYAEALIDAKRQKGNRNDVEGRIVMGNTDSIILEGSQNRLFSTLWIRIFRYIEMDIVTQDDPLQIDDFYSVFSAYPFKEKGAFVSNDPILSDIWKTGWRTARLCAGETYFDCPYYEQLQYVGDTRIQALISLYVSGDDRLMRNAITDLYHSMTDEGLTQSRYPTDNKQMIPPFSLFWVSMVYDYWMHRRDDAFLQPLLPSVRQVLTWYENHLDSSTQILGPASWWNFVDWAPQFKFGVPAGGKEGGSAILSGQFAYTLRQAAQVFDYFNRREEGAHYLKLADQTASAVYRLCFDPGREAMADTPDKKTFSQHASIMGVLSEAVPEPQRKAVMNKILLDTSMIQATFYYRFYLNLALKKAGMADLYYSQLTPWRNMLKLGLTTFAENPEPVRSDCHAWSASPVYDLLATICGIMPATSGFSSVKIQPAMGELMEIEGKTPHPLGEILVQLKRKGASGVVGSIKLPRGLPGVFIWNNQAKALTEGVNMIDL